jgi:hypothetical protein
MISVVGQKKEEKGSQGKQKGEENEFPPSLIYTPANSLSCAYNLDNL